MSADDIGLCLFDRLCETANAIVALREDFCTPASDLWCALTLIAQHLDVLIDAVVQCLPIEGLGEDAL